MGNFGGQEIIQSPVGTISQANVAQLVVVAIMLAISCHIVLRISDKMADDLETMGILMYSKIVLALLILLIYLILFSKLCLLIPAIVL